MRQTIAEGVFASLDRLGWARCKLRDCGGWTVKGTSRRLPTTYRRLCVSLAGWDRRHQRRWVNARLRHPDTRDLPSGLLSEDKVFWKEFMVASRHGRIKERRMFSASALTYTSFFNRPMSPPLTTVQSRGSRRPAPRIPGRAARGWPSRLQGRSGSGQLLRASNAFFPSHRSVFQERRPANHIRYADHRLAAVGIGETQVFP